MPTATFLEEDVRAANKLAECMDNSNAPKFLIYAMAGLNFNEAAPDDFSNSKNELEPLAIDEQETPVKGLILSKDHIIKIKIYVAAGLAFPTETEDIKRYLKYDASFDSGKCPEISPEAFKKLFITIKEHCKLWSGLESDIKKTGTSLNLFGIKFVSTGTDITSVIDVMPIMDRIKKMGEHPEEYSIPFGEDDKLIQVSLVELLNMLKKSVAEKQAETRALLDRLIAYRETMDNRIVPDTAGMSSALKKLDLDKERERLLQRRGELEKEIEVLNKTYKQMVGYAFTGASGLILGPIGAISWAVTGGIFGAKAEQARKERNKKEAELNENNRKFDATDKLIKFVTSTSDRISNLSVVISEAVTGVQNLEVLWDAVMQYIDESAKNLESIEESSSLILFSGKMKESVELWRNVKDITGELVRLFEAASKEAEKLAQDEARKEQM